MERMVQSFLSQQRIRSCLLEGIYIYIYLFFAKKQNESYSTVISWLRTKLSFCVLRSVILCVRGSRTPWLVKNDFEIGEDFQLNNAEAGLF